jgi:hypothetical protein
VPAGSQPGAIPIDIAVVVFSHRGGGGTAFNPDKCLNIRQLLIGKRIALITAEVEKK